MSCLAIDISQLTIGTSPCSFLGFWSLRRQEWGSLHYSGTAHSSRRRITFLGIDSGLITAGYHPVADSLDIEAPETTK